MSSVTVESGSNIAFIKYWGARDLERVVPFNRSLSMTLDTCRSICSLEFRDGVVGDDEVWLAAPDGTLTAADDAFAGRVLRQLDRLRSYFDKSGQIVMATRNTFPSSAGIASSASGFSALTVAATRALGADCDGAELSRLSMLSGSGSASRSVFGGYVEWSDRDEGQVGAHQVRDESWWTLHDLIVVVDTEPKEVSSRDGHRLATTSPYFEARLRDVKGRRIRGALEAVEARDFDALGPIVEEEAIDMHLIAMSSSPPIFYWKPATLTVLDAVRRARQDGLAGWSTLDAGANVHVICEPSSSDELAVRLEALDGVVEVIRDHTGGPPQVRAGADLLAGKR
ncbi:MAG: diphosphomevalonate decarboxylase [Acidobacteriota bacterium]